MGDTISAASSAAREFGREPLLGNIDNSASLITEIAGVLQTPPGTSLAVVGPVGEGRVLRAEQDLKVRFPPSFRAFLKHFGAGLVFDYSILGLVEESGHWLDIVRANLLTPPQIVPRFYLLFAYSGGDEAYHLDTSRQNYTSECPVVALRSGGMRRPVADSFLGFLTKAQNRMARGPHPHKAQP